MFRYKIKFKKLKTIKEKFDATVSNHRRSQAVLITTSDCLLVILDSVIILFILMHSCSQKFRSRLFFWRLRSN